MRIVRVRARTIGWRLDGRGASRGRRVRAAVIIEVTAADDAPGAPVTGDARETSASLGLGELARPTRGSRDSVAVGLGEAAPLPGVSRDTLDDAHRAAATLAARLPLGLDDHPRAIAQLAATLTDAPAARFAIESALLATLAARSARALSELLATTSTGARRAPGTPGALRSADVVDDPEAARDARAGVLKIKVGPELARELARVRAIAAAAPGARLRLDANRTWPRAAALDHLAAFADLPIDFVEEPCPDAIALLDQPLALPIALDESLADLAPDALAAALCAPGLGALILKPTLLGGFAACLDLAHRARAAGKPAIVTHALEGPIGTAACIELARAVTRDAPASPAMGLAPHPALAAWRLPAPALTTLTLDELCAAASDPLSISAAAREAPDHAALHDPTWDEAALAAPHRDPTWDEASIAAPPDTHGAEHEHAASEERTFAACAARVARAGVPARVVIAAPAFETIEGIYAALEARAPIALVHPGLPEAERARQRALVEAAELGGDDAVVLFTSGSTGAPRGVVLGRAALLAAAAASEAHLGARADDRWLLALSLAHAGGLAIVVRALAGRRPVALLRGAFARDAAARALETCTLASLVPAQLAMLLDDPTWRPPARLRALLRGGAAAPPALLDAARARGVPVLPTFGLTETFGQVATASAAHADRRGLVALPGVTLAAGTRAEPAPIRVRGPMLATRYLDGAPIAPELVTADLGFVEDGALHVVGRADDVIVTGGAKVHPQTIEAVLAATPHVRAACAFAVADPRWGHVIGAALAVAPGFELAAAAALARRAAGARAPAPARRARRAARLAQRQARSPRDRRAPHRAGALRPGL